MIAGAKLFHRCSTTFYSNNEQTKRKVKHAVIVIVGKLLQYLRNKTLIGCALTGKHSINDDFPLITCPVMFYSSHICYWWRFQNKQLLYLPAQKWGFVIGHVSYLSLSPACLTQRTLPQSVSSINPSSYVTLLKDIACLPCLIRKKTVSSERWSPVA